MTLFEIPGGDFVLTMTPIECLHDEEGDHRHDWIKVDMRAEVPGLRAETQWILMRVGIDKFRGHLDKMYGSISEGRLPANVSFRPLEKVLELDLTLTDLRFGSIQLDFVIRPEPHSRNRLSGSTVIDQSFLPGLSRGLQALSRFDLET